MIMISWIRNLPNSLWGKAVEYPKKPSEDEKDIIRAEFLKNLGMELHNEYLKYQNNTDWTGDDFKNKMRILTAAAKAMGMEKEITDLITSVRIYHLNSLDQASNLSMKKSEEIFERVRKNNPSPT